MFLGLLSTPLLASSGPVLVTDFGARPNTQEDATTAVAAALRAAQGKHAVVEFPKGDYHFYRENGAERELFLSNSDVVNPRRIAILIENRRDIRLKGNGARLLFHGRVIPFAIIDSKDITLEGFVVDWPRPLMSQGTVVQSDRTGITLSIDKAEFPYAIEDGQLVFTDATWKRKPWGLMEFDPKTKGVAYRTGDDGPTDGNWRQGKASEPFPGHVRLDFPSSRGPAVGNVLVFRHGARDHAGTFIEGSKNVTLSNLAYRHTSGLGVLAQYTENLTFKDVDVAPDSGSGRMFAGHDDGFHFSNCKGRINVDSCEFQGLMDDPINVHGTAVQVISRSGASGLRCRFMHGQSVGLRFADPGDMVSFIDHETLLSRRQDKVRAVRHLTPEEFEIEFEREVPPAVRIGDALENLTWTPSFTVRNSIFGRVRARGLLISTPKKVMVEGNLFRSSGAAILIAGDANYWFESGAVADVTVRRNRFEDCNSSSYQFGDAIISVHPEIPTLGSSAYHRGIKIEENTFVVFDAPILWAKSVQGLTFRDNRVLLSETFKPWHGNRDGLTFLGCEDVLVERNTLPAGYLGKTVRIEGGKPASISVKGWR